MAKKSSGSVVYSNQPGAKNSSAGGKPHPSPNKVVTGAGPSGSSNWTAIKNNNGGVSGKGC